MTRDEKTEMVNLADLRSLAGTRGLDAGTVAEYAEAMQRGATFPAVIVGRLPDGGLVRLDGGHRCEAGRRIGRETVGAVVMAVGDLAEAQWLASAMNAQHGLPRSPDAKRAAVRLALEARPDTSDSTIAEHCRVSRDLVAAVRAECPLAETASRVGRDGRKINTTRIGRTPTTAPPPAPLAETASQGDRDGWQPDDFILPDGASLAFLSAALHPDGLPVHELWIVPSEHPGYVFVTWSERDAAADGLAYVGDTRGRRDYEFTRGLLAEQVSTWGPMTRTVIPHDVPSEELGERPWPYNRFLFDSQEHASAARLHFALTGRRLDLDALWEGVTREAETKAGELEDGQ